MGIYPFADSQYLLFLSAADGVPPQNSLFCFLRIILFSWVFVFSFIFSLKKPTRTLLCSKARCVLTAELGFMAEHGDDLNQISPGIWSSMRDSWAGADEPRGRNSGWRNSKSSMTPTGAVPLSFLGLGWCRFRIFRLLSSRNRLGCGLGWFVLIHLNKKLLIQPEPQSSLSFSFCFTQVSWELSLELCWLLCVL